MNQIEKLRQRLIELQAKADDITNSARDDGRQLTANERADLETILSSFESTEADLRLLERSNRNSAALDTNSRGRQTTADPIGGGYRHGAEPRAAARNVVHRDFGLRDSELLLSLREGSRDTGEWSNLGEFMQVLASGRHDPRLKVFNAQTEGTGSEGGYLVPVGFSNDALGGAIVSSELLRRVDSYPMTTNILQVAGANTLNHTGGSIAGVALTWVGEGGQIPSSSALIHAITLQAKKAAILLDATNELLDDSRVAGRTLTEIMRDATRLGLERALLVGSGAGQPLGVLGSPALITAAAIGGQTADTLKYENLTEMLGRLHPGLLGDAIWVASPSCMAQLLNIAFPVKNVAGDQNVGGSNGSATVSPNGNFSLLGLPLVFSEVLPQLGDVGDILLIAPSQMALGLRRDVSIATDTSQKFDYDMTRFRLTLRVDAQGKWATAMTPAAGPTLSWCVALQAR